MKGDVVAVNGLSVEGANGSTLTFDGLVNVGSKNSYLRTVSGSAFVFNGKVTVNEFQLGNAYNANGAVYFNNPSNSITKMATYLAVVHCGDTNVLRGAYWSIMDTATRSNGGHILNLHGHDQTMRFLAAEQFISSATPSDNSTLITSDEPCKFTIATDSSTARTTGHKINGAVSLVMDATKKTYTQIFTDVKAGVTTTHSTTGTITVKKGVLKIAGSATTFSGVPQVTVEADGTLNVDSSGQTVFPAVTNFTVNGTLSVGASAGTPFSSGTSSLILGEGASFSIANDTKPLFSAVYVEEGGELTKLAKGTYESSDGRVSQLTAGGFTVVGSSVVDSATWTGAGGADTDVETAENWSEEGVDVTSGILSAMFAQAGNTATVSSAVKFNNVTLCAAEGEDGFTFAKGADDASFAVAGTSLAISDTDSTNRTYAFDVPFEIDGAQTLVASVPANKTLAFRDGFRAKYGSVDFEAGSAVSGTTPIPIRMEGSNVVSGSITLPTGLELRLEGTLEAPDGVDQGLAAVDGASTVTVKGGNAYLDRLFGLVLVNASVSKPVCINGNGSYSQKYLLHTAANTTNVISGNLLFSPSAGWSWFRLRDCSELVCSGGVRTRTGPVHVNGGVDSRLVFVEKPVTANVEYVYSASSKRYGFAIDSGRVVFDVCGNAIDYLVPGANDSAGKSVALEFLRSDMFSGYATTLVAGMENRQAGTFVPFATAASQTVEFHSTTQRFERVISGATATFTGDAGSMLEVRGAQEAETGDKIHVTDENLFVAAKFEGGLSLKMSGTGTLVMTNATSSTTGGVEVASGVVRFAPDAAWTNASFVAVGGTGRLEIEAADGFEDRLLTFGRDAALSLSGDGVISVPNGCTLCVAKLSFGGRTVPKGQYTYATAPADLKEHLADTTGTIRVGRGGMIVSIK